ncbi:hypothetical protein [Caudoviricetes sp.]|nr:hypothetical protein [Caudoviricetes sp.]UOF81515.1 hypothetical protein [Caudoviricetes sp.]
MNDDIGFIKGLCLAGAALFLFVLAASLAACESAGRFAAYCLQNPRNCD